MKIGKYLLQENLITNKQRREGERQHDKTGKRFGACLVNLGYISDEELDKALDRIDLMKKERKPMAHKIGENTAFQMDLKFLVTIGAVLVSAVAVYFTLTGAVEDNTKEINNIKSMGDLKIISYKLDEYDETFKELKSLSTTLSPLATDLTYIKEEINKLKNRKINIPEVDLSGIDDCKDKLDALADKLDAFETRINKLEKCWIEMSKHQQRKYKKSML